MREYDDDNIRLYTPVLQRVIILLAVIIAVPVVMWTITTMVRTYVAAPKAPTFQRMTEAPPADTASIAASAVQAAPAAATLVGHPQPAAPTSRLADAAAATASDARTPLLDIRKPTDQLQPASIIAPSAPPQNAIAVASPVAPVPAAPEPPVPAVPSKMAVARAVPAASGPPTAAAGSASAAATQPTPSASPMQVAANTPAPPAAAPSSIVWPNPNATAPPPMGSTSGNAARDPAPSEPIAAAPQPSASSETASDDLPPGQPINGRVPLPPRRPMLFAMVQTAVPLPRPRPADATAATPATPAEAPGSSYEPGMEPGHY